MIRRPRRSPLFPYTPLFRSHRRSVALEHQDVRGLDVPVNDFFLMRMLDGLAHLDKQFEPLRSIQLMLVAIPGERKTFRSEEHTSELQSRSDLVCRLLLEKKK